MCFGPEGVWDVPLLCFLGRIAHQKGVHLLLDCVRRYVTSRNVPFRYAMLACPWKRHPSDAQRRRSVPFFCPPRCEKGAARYSDNGRGVRAETPSRTPSLGSVTCRYTTCRTSAVSCRSMPFRAVPCRSMPFHAVTPLDDPLDPVVDTAGAGIAAGFLRSGPSPCLRPCRPLRRLRRPLCQPDGDAARQVPTAILGAARPLFRAGAR